jgi:hypothetical protein
MLIFLRCATMVQHRYFKSLTAYQNRALLALPLTLEWGTSTWHGVCVALF